MVVAVSLVSMMKVAFMFDGGMPAAWTVCMGMLTVRFVSAHRGGLI